MATLFLALKVALFAGATTSQSGDGRIALGGSWRFALDRDDQGVPEKWMNRTLTGNIRLPGDLAEQGIGDEPSLETKWTGGIQSPTWWKDPALSAYAQPGNFAFPYWLTPDRHYIGAAWYQRDIEVPPDWAGRRIVLFLERPHWETRVWVDGRLIGANNALGTPHEHELGRLSPGKHVLTIRVDNRLVVDVGINSHSISDHTQGNWNGIVGLIELRSTPEIWIDELRVAGEFPNRGFKVQGRIGSLARTPGAGKVLLTIAEAAPQSRGLAPRRRQAQHTVDVQWNADGGEFETRLTPQGGAKPWDEFSPALYEITATLGDHQVSAVTGLREVTAPRTQFVLNGRTIFLRGTLECAIFPATGHPPMDVAWWRNVITRARAHGLNHLRFHSWCPPKAAFIAADELGFYYQIEASSWANQSTTLGDGKPVDRWIYEETDRILKYYGNHPSFLLMAYGNEPGGPNHKQYLSKWVQHYKSTDPRRLYTSGAGWPQLPENEFHVTPDPRVQAWGEGLKSRINALPPETRTDYRDYISARAVPVISHEIGQWCVYPNFDEMRKYTGYLKARNFQIFKDSLEANHMGRLSRRFLLASGKLQVLCYKEDIESALRTPGMAGFQLLDLHDFPGQGTALVGVLDPFWDSKGYVTAEEYARFCNSIVPLARMQKRVFTTSEDFLADVELFNFGGETLSDARLEWTLESATGKTWASGDLRAGRLEAGTLHSVGTIQTGLSKVPAPAQGKLMVSLKGRKFRNEWDIWVYPEVRKMDAPPGITISSEFDNATLEKLEKGGRVLLLIPPSRVKPDPERGRVALGFSSIFWNTAWTRQQPPHTLGILCDPKHPLFAIFPTDFHSNWQWWYLVSRAGAMILDDLPPRLEPGVRVIDDWVTNRRLALLFEARIGRGKLIVCSVDLEHDLESDPVRTQFRSSLLEYMAGAKFNPTVAVDPAQVAALVSEPSPMEKLGARIRFSCESMSGYEPENVLDGNPQTFWHTGHRDKAHTFPHELQIELRRPMKIGGFTAVPRQDGNPNGTVKDYQAFASMDGAEWIGPLARGTFPPGTNAQNVSFAPVEARFFRLVILSGHAKGNWGSLAELTLQPVYEK